jgi:hypothetical protein
MIRLRIAGPKFSKREDPAPQPPQPELPGKNPSEPELPLPDLGRVFFSRTRPDGPRPTPTGELLEQGKTL